MEFFVSCMVACPTPRGYGGGGFYWLISDGHYTPLGTRASMEFVVPAEIAIWLKCGDGKAKLTSRLLPECRE